MRYRNQMRNRSLPICNQLKTGISLEPKDREKTRFYSKIQCSLFFLKFLNNSRTQNTHVLYEGMANISHKVIVEEILMAGI